MGKTNTEDLWCDDLIGRNSPLIYRQAKELAIINRELKAKLANAVQLHIEAAQLATKLQARVDELEYGK